MSARLGFAWRLTALSGVGAGLALAPLRGPPPGLSLPLLGALLVALVLARPRAGRGLAWLGLLTAFAVMAGLGIGQARLAAIDGGALQIEPGTVASLRGAIASVPRASSGFTRFALEVDGRRIGVEARGEHPELDEGRVVDVRGEARIPAPWQAAALARQGASRVLAAHEVESTEMTRGGFRGALDGIRRRAEAALERGTPSGSGALLRGFVLGQDDRIPADVRDEFRRSGLAHILAVSGQNVMLLVLLATPFLALSGLSLRVRLLVLLALIAVYVPVAGAGASIQRAGVMGAAGVVAALAGRPRARWYALALAAAATLAANPRASGDIGWQLSFAAVAGLLVLAQPISRLLRGGAPAGSLRRLLADGAAMTTAATLATAPLIAHHFEVVSLTALPANLVALPAVAPAMWLGMLAGALGQAPGAPVEPLTGLGGLCAGFIGWTARVLGGPSAQLEIARPSLPAALLLAIALLLAARLLCLALERRESLRPAPRGSRQARPALALAAVIALAGALVSLTGRPEDGGPPPALGLRALDVGQGDAILLEPRGSPAMLVDTGPPGGAAADRLTELGVERLAAIVLTHDDLDHSGALPELLSRFAVARVVFAQGAVPEHCRHAPCPALTPLAAGGAIRLGRLRLDVLWPHASGTPGPPDEPNARSLVLRAGLGRFSALLTGDAEAEVAPVDPGPVDLLKVAHHGSADSGLPELLGRASPRIGLISVGSDNRHGHPAPETLAALAQAGVQVRRTDEHGEVLVEVRDGGWSVE